MLAFLAVYLIWGSTYLGIKVALESMPPYFMAGSRFFVAGALLLGWLAVRGRLPSGSFTPRRLGLSALVGVLMLAVGNGLVVWSIERQAPTGLVAVLVATTPFWLVILERFADASRRITPQIVAGLLAGFLGMLVLSGVLGPQGVWGSSGAETAPHSGAASGDLPVAVLVAMLVATLAWSCGSLLSRRSGRAQVAATGTGAGIGSAESTAAIARPVDPLLAPALQMLAGGAAMLVVSAASEPWSELDLAAVTLRSWVGYWYLVFFGSIVAYSAFIWLLRHVSAAMVGTYAYVNPVVAVLLGALVLGESLTARTAVASALILLAVVLITTAKRPSTRESQSH